MKKILALMLALMLAFSCCAMAEETIDSMTITGSLTFDAGQITSLAAMFGMGENAQPIVNAVLSILNSLGGRVVLSGGGMQGELLPYLLDNGLDGLFGSVAGYHYGDQHLPLPSFKALKGSVLCSSTQTPSPFARQTL